MEAGELDRLLTELRGQGLKVVRGSEIKSPVSGKANLQMGSINLVESIRGVAP